MLRSFRVANHRSLRDEQELNLLPAYDQSAPVVPVVAIFGANASGKSNLLDALMWMRSAVLDSYRSWEVESGIPRQPFRLDPAVAAAPSTFAVDLTIDGVDYSYGFSVDDDVVIEEWLSSYPQKRERVIFTRDRKRVEFGSTVPERRSRAELLGGLMRDNSLLLSTAVQAGQAEVLPVYRWFRSSLQLAGRSALLGPAFSSVVGDAIVRLPAFVPLLRVADLGISDVLVEAEPGSAIGADALLDEWRASVRAFPNYTIHQPPKITLRFLHGGDNVPLGLEDQSAGTVEWANLLVHALVALESGGVLVVDEVDASLHPRLTARLIELFRNGEANGRAQLVFSTHDATLLGTDLGEEVLRRDEIWFVEKRDGASKLYPLSDFHPRKGENRERRYLAGSYGAVPAIFTDSLVESVLATRTEPPDAQA